MTVHELELKKLELEEQIHKDNLELSLANIELEREKRGRFSAGAVTFIGSVVALLSAAITAFLGGQAELAVHKIQVEAERERLAQNQRFEIIVQATKGLPTEVAAKNLSFFVKAGILTDKHAAIERLASQGEAPQFSKLDVQLFSSVPSPHKQELQDFFDAAIFPLADVVPLETGITLNLRVAPKADAPVSGVLVANQTVRVLSLFEGWAEVEVDASKVFDKNGLGSMRVVRSSDKVRGWIRSQYLSKPYVKRRFRN